MVFFQCQAKHTIDSKNFYISKDRQAFTELKDLKLSKDMCYACWQAV